jgi:hypothetical protein
MHINDVYALRSVLKCLKSGMPADPVLVNALLEAADEEVKEFEQRLELMALEEEARQGEIA